MEHLVRRLILAGMVIFLFVPAEAAFAPSGLIHVPNNTVLGRTSTIAQSAVIRDGFAAIGDAPPLQYTASGSACPLNSGNGDGGLQVKSANGKCWLANFSPDGADIRQWGAKCDWNGSTGTDDAAALTSAITYAATGNKIRIPPLACRLNSHVAVTSATQKINISIIGFGPDSSKLIWTNAAPAGLSISLIDYDTVTIGGISFETTQVSGGTGLTLTQVAGHSTSEAPPNTITNVVFRGDNYQGATKYWTIANQVNSLSNVIWDSVGFIATDGTVGTGIDLEATAGLPGYVFNVQKSSFIALGTGLKYGDRIQGVTVGGGSNFTTVGTGILVPAAGSGLDQLAVIGNQFEPVASGYGIRDQAGVNGTQIIGNTFVTDKANTFGVSFEANATRTITGNEFQAGSGTSTGIQITAGGGTIAANVFADQNIGVKLGASSSFVNGDTMNFYSGTATPLSDSGTNNYFDGDFTFTPTVLGESVAGTPTYTVNKGAYHRHHKRISAQFSIGVSALGGMSGNLDIAGFPGVNSPDVRGSCTFGVAAGLTGNPPAGAWIDINANPPVAHVNSDSTQISAYTAPLRFDGVCEYTLP